MSAPVPLIALEDLSPADRERCYQFLVGEDVQFFRDDDGSYVANMRMYDPDVMNELGIAPVATGRTDGGGRQSEHTGARRQKNVRQHRKIAQSEIYGVLAEKDALFDYSLYPRFCSLISMRDSVMPKLRPLSWLMRQIEELYDTRYSRETAELREEASGGGRGRQSSGAPAFVVEFLSKRYGLRQLVDQTAWDLLYNTHSMRSEFLEVELFARFLEETYDADDLLFFLHVRATVQKELRFNFRARWTELGKGTLNENRAPAPVFLSQRECKLVARILFGSESDPFFKTFMALVDSRLKKPTRAVAVGAQRLGEGDAGDDGRRIEVMQFLYLALSEYHDTRPAEELEAAAAARAASAHSMERAREAAGQPRARSQAARGDEPGGGVTSVPADREDLFLEAEKEYNARFAGGSSNPAQNGHDVVGGAPDSGASLERIHEPDRAAPPSPAPAQEPGARAMLELLGDEMHAANERFLDEALGSAQVGLPAEVAREIRQEVQGQLEARVDTVLDRIIGQGDADGDTLDGLRAKFQAMLAHPQAEGVGDEVRAFVLSVLESPEVSGEVKPLATLLTTYAEARITEGAASH